MTNEDRIIGIHPNTNGFGFVILNEKGEILDYGITTVRPIKNDKCMLKIKELVGYYNPSIIILEDYRNSNKSKRVKDLIKRIELNLKSTVKISKYSKEQIKGIFEIFGARNKFEISQKIAEMYPEFKSKLPHKRKPWLPENYYQGLFDAMTLVLVYQYLND